MDRRTLTKWIVVAIAISPLAAWAVAFVVLDLLGLFEARVNGHLRTNGQPVVGARVRLWGHNERRFGRTDSLGQFAFTKLDPGEYFVGLRFERKGVFWCDTPATAVDFYSRPLNSPDIEASTQIKIEPRQDLALPIELVCSPPAPSANLLELAGLADAGAPMVSLEVPHLSGKALVLSDEEAGLSVHGAHYELPYSVRAKRYDEIRTLIFIGRATKRVVGKYTLDGAPTGGRDAFQLFRTVTAVNPSTKTMVWRHEVGGSPPPREMTTRFTTGGRIIRKDSVDTGGDPSGEEIVEFIKGLPRL